jgi:site-specific DNA recombinase
MMKKSHCSIAAIYARVSSEQQAEAATIASQVAALEERVTQDGLALEPQTRFLDEGYSGATLIRPALERLRDLAATGAIDRLYVHNPDRLARKYAYQVLLLDEFSRCGVEVIFLNHRVGQTPEEDLLLQVQGMVAEYERAKILERSRRGKLHAARQGSVNVLSGAPYGYRYIRCWEGDGEARYEIVMEEAQVIREMFEWVGRDGLSIGEVCRRLKRQGVPSPKGKSYWDRTTVWGHLKNPAYRGTAIFGKTRSGPKRPHLRAQRGRPEQSRRAYSVYDVPEDEGIRIVVPAIVGEELFAAVGERLQENRKRNRQSRRGAKYLLQGLLVCARCGYAFYGKPVSLKGGKGKRRDYAYYRCVGSDAYRFGGERICHNKQVRTDLLEEAVWQDVCSLLQNPRRIEREYQRRLKRDARGSQIDERLPSRIQKIQCGIARLVDAYEEGLLEKSEFEPRLRRSRDRLTKLEAEAKKQEENETQRTELRLVIGRLQEFAERIQSGLHDADWLTRREILRALVKRVEVDEAHVRVIYRVDPLPFDQGPSGGRLQHCWRGEHRALRRAGFRRPLRAVFQDFRLQKRGDQLQHGAVGDLLLQSGHQAVVRNRVEVAFQVGVHDVNVAGLKQLFDPAQGVLASASRSESVAVFREVTLEDRLDDVHDRRLNHPIPHRGNAQGAGFGRSGLGDLDTSHGLRSIRAAAQHIGEFPNAVGKLSLEVLHRRMVYAGRAVVARHLLERRPQIPFGKHLVKQSEPLSSFHSLFQSRQHANGPSARFDPPPSREGLFGLLSLRHCRREVFLGLGHSSFIFLVPFAHPALPGFFATMEPLTPVRSRRLVPDRSPCFMCRTFPPFRLQPPVVVPGDWSGFVPEPTARPVGRIPTSGPGRRLGFTITRRLATTTGRIKFVIILRTSGLPPVALHLLSQGRSYFRLQRSDPTWQGLSPG